MSAQQNDISSLYFHKQNFADRIDGILALVQKESGFVVEKLLQKSAWWSSKNVGAFHYLGTFNGEPSILKIQGVRPKVSEADNIQQFAAQNKSTLIRPPHLLWSMPWNNEWGFEALVMENLDSEKLVGLPAAMEQVDEFFNVYAEYRRNCLQTPWLEKPSVSLSEGVQKAFAQWRKIAAELSPDHPLRKPEDAQLILRAVDTLVKEYVDIDWQFQHGHFSARDIFPKNGQYVVLSNLYWSWRAPYYDAVFGFHWYQCDLASKEGTTIEQLDQHRRWWKQTIQNVANPQEKRLLELAFLERAAAGLNLDAILDPSPVTEWLVGTLRQEIQASLPQK